MRARGQTGQRVGAMRFVAAATVLVFGIPLGAQGPLAPAAGTPGVAGEMRTVSGRVLSGSADSLKPIAGQMVVLHRISADSSGPVDSARTSSAGTYRFRYRLEGPRSMYIVSVRYSGVAYFTSPLREAAVTSPDGDVSVYDTTSTRFPLAVRARHFVIAPPEAGFRRVVDVFEVANDSNRTLVAGAEGLTWRVALPPDAREPGTAGGDLPPEAFRFNGGNAELMIPFPPGSRQLVLTYGIPAQRSVTIPVSDAVSTLEVLMEGTGGRITGAGLAVEEPVSMEGRTFQRYTATTVPRGATFTINRAGGISLGGNAGRVALLAVALVAVALGVVIGRRAPATAPERLATPDALAREIAALDRVYATPAKRTGDGGAYYQSRRAELLERLMEAQAVEEHAPTA